MAGIGFHLQKLLKKDTYFSSFNAYFYSTLISSGPWILSILTLFSLGYFAPSTLDIFEMTYFRTLIIYISAFSLIVTGLFQYPVTRYVADRLYGNEDDALVPVFNAAAFCMLGIQAAAGFLFFLVAGGFTRTHVLALMVYLSLSLIWILMIFLTALRDYKAIAAAYVAGSAVTVITALFLGSRWGIDGYLTGYLAGHLVIAGLWTLRLFIEFPSRDLFDWAFLDFMKKNRILMFTGFFYSLALWIDKIVFWLSPQATVIAPNLRIFPFYESAGFAAFLTIIPAMSIFLVQVETDFYRRYRNFYTSINSKSPLDHLQQLREKINHALRTSLQTLILYQGLVTFLAIVFAPEILTALRMQWAQVPVFRVCVLGAFLHSLLLVTLLIILYFDLKTIALQVSFTFLILNAALTLITTFLPLPFLGYGYLMACWGSLIFAFSALDRKLKNLVFLTFAGQPVGGQTQE